MCYKTLPPHYPIKPPRKNIHLASFSLKMHHAQMLSANWIQLVSDCIQYSSTKGWPLERKWTLSDFTDALQLIQVFSQLGRNTDEETSPLLKFLNDFYSIILHRSKKNLGKNLSQIVIESYELESLWHSKSLTKHCFKVQVYLVRKSGFSELVQRNHGEL